MPPAVAMTGVQLTISSARNLPNMDFVGKTDAFVTVTMNGTEVMKTKVVDDNLDPVWDAKATIAWDGSSELKFSVWDSNNFAKDKWIGQCELDKRGIRSNFQGPKALSTGKTYRKSQGNARVPMICIEAKVLGAMTPIQLNIVNAKDLPNMDWGWRDLSDPYVKVTMSGTEVMRTKVVDNNLNPVWDAKATIYWDGSSELILSVFDSNTVTQDDFIGQYVLDKGQIRASFSGTVPLTTKKTFPTEPTISIRVAVIPSEGCCAGCSVM